MTARLKNSRLWKLNNHKHK